MKVLVVGAAAGLMAAGAAVRQGHTVTVLEHKEKPLRRSSSRERGAATSPTTAPLRNFLHHVRTNPRFLYSSLGAFPPAKTMELFECLGVELKVERGRRVFPVSDKAEEIRQALLRYAEGAVLIEDGAQKLLLEPLAQEEEAARCRRKIPATPRRKSPARPAAVWACGALRAGSTRRTPCWWRRAA